MPRGRKDDLTGKKYGMLTVLGYAGKDKHGASLWKCRCDCGTVKNLNGWPIKSGAIVSCGCKKKSIHPGEKYGRLTTLEPIVKNKQYYWKCKCECGNVVDVWCGNLKSGNSLSCGCLSKELNSDRSTTHGLSKTRLYGIWVGMIQRCKNQNVKSYMYYGGRGIKICKEWESFDNFAEWALANG